MQSDHHELWIIRNCITILISVIVFGTIGFYFLEEAQTLWDSFYFTFVTVSTVGYGDIAPKTLGGKILSITVIFLGVGSIFITIPAFFEILIKKKLKEVLKMPKEKVDYKGHVIICGWGKVGKALVEGIRAEKKEFVVIEGDSQRVRDMVEHDIPVVQGDACSEEILINAGIESASKLLASLDDTANVFIALTAKILNPSIEVISKVDYFTNEAKLRKAGVDKIVNCHEMGAKKILELTHSYYI